jgi:hypothetical protein
MQMIIRPSHGNLKDEVEIGNGADASDQQTAPNHRADTNSTTFN